jgi:hypothetical protein
VLHAEQFATMAEIEYYRGGPSLRVRDRDIRVNRRTGLLATDRGVSVSNQRDGLEHFGGAYRVTQLPPELKIIQVGAKTHHFEIVPLQPMSRAAYEEALGKIKLVPSE